MERRGFLKLTATGAAGLAFEQMGLAADANTSVPRENWAGNYRYHTDHVLSPRSLDEVRDAVRSIKNGRALGSRHSFNGIADSTDTQISTLGLTGFQLDRQGRTVTAGAGTKYGDLAKALDAQGFALHNLASLPHITVAGSISTATHGSGLGNGNLATAVRGLRFVSADGSVHSLSQGTDGERFAGAVVGLGGLGVITDVTLEVQPRYEVAQVVYLDLPFDQLEHHFEQIMSAGYSVSLFTTWENRTVNQVWIKRRVDQGAGAPPAAFYGGHLATQMVHPVAGMDTQKTTEQMNIPGPWYQRLPHFKMEFTPSAGKEIQSEYFVPLDRAYEAVNAVSRLHERITPHLLVTELRAVAADNLWMSMAYGRRSLAIHFTWKPEAEAVLAVLPEIERVLAPFNPRPHWGKVFTMKAALLEKQYPRFGDYKSLAAGFDPDGKFRNRFMTEDVWA